MSRYAVENIIYLKTDSQLPPQAVLVYSLSGELIKEISPVNNMTIDLADFSAGVYFLVLMLEDHSERHKIVISKY